jgi:hypothetical protein
MKSPTPTLTDDDLRKILRAMLDDDDECPLTAEARREGPTDPHAVAYFLAGCLCGTVHRLHQVLIGRDLALRIVLEEFKSRWGVDVEIETA